MPLIFDGLTIPGLVKRWAPDPWDEQVQVFTSFGLEGEGHLYGGITGRNLSIPVWVFGGYETADALFAMLSSISAKSRAGRIATLVEQSGVNITYQKCRLRPVEWDKAGALPPNPNLGWSYSLVLHFRQLRP